MKTSFYNYEWREGPYLLLYNAATDQVAVLRPETAALYDSCRQRPDELAERHKEFYDYLCGNGFLVPDGTDEPQAVVRRWQSDEAADRTFMVTVNPTLDCNMQCWYCYEKHERRMDMDETVRDALSRLIAKQAASGRYDSIALSFFGGEPLMRYADTVRPLLEGAAAACRRHGPRLTVHFTTNGYLIDEAMLRELEAYDVSFQIPIDGNRRVHDLVKRTGDDNGTYRRTIDNVCSALAHGFSVAVRFNYTARFLPSFIDVLPEFQDLDKSARSRLSFDFQHVWQDEKNTSQEMRDTLQRLIKAFHDAGFYVNDEVSRLPTICYADKMNHIVVNYDGNLYHCTARDFTAANAEGRLEADGIMCLNRRHDERMALRFGNDTCRHCRAYPLCHGGCTQHKLEFRGQTGCLKGLDAEGREELLRKRLLWLVEEKHRSTAQAAG